VVANRPTSFFDFTIAFSFSNRIQYCFRMFIC
jgi:hypothetical protein